LSPKSLAAALWFLGLRRRIKKKKEKNWKTQTLAQGQVGEGGISSRLNAWPNERQGLILSTEQLRIENTSAKWQKCLRY